MTCVKDTRRLTISILCLNYLYFSCYFENWSDNLGFFNYAERALVTTDYILMVLVIKF